MVAVRATVWFLFAFYCCCALTIMPMPDVLFWLRPQWLVLWVIFLQLRVPSHFNPILAWCMGLLVDGLMGATLGQYALVFAVTGYLTACFTAQLNNKTAWQQLPYIGLMVCLAQMMILWFHLYAGENPHTLFYWLSSMTSCLCWPIFASFMQYLMRKLHCLPRRGIHFRGF